MSDWLLPQFLVACTHLYKPLCWLVGWFIRQSVGRLVGCWLLGASNLWQSALFMIQVPWISYAYCHLVLVFFWIRWCLVSDVSFLTYYSFWITEDAYCASISFSIFCCCGWHANIFYSEISGVHNKWHYLKLFKEINPQNKKNVISSCYTVKLSDLF